MQSVLDFPFSLLQELGFEIHLFLTSVAWPCMENRCLRLVGKDGPRIGESLFLREPKASKLR